MAIQFRVAHAVSRAGDGVSPSRTFLCNATESESDVNESSFRRDAETDTRGACATQKCGFSFGCNHCAHSSKAAGSPRRYASASPAKCNEPVMRIGFGFVRVSLSASPIEGVMEQGSDGVMTDKIWASCFGSAVRSLRIFGKRTESAIVTSSWQIPRKSLSDRMARIKVARCSPKISRQVSTRTRAAAGL